MANHLMQKLVTHEGICCIFRYFEIHKDRSSLALALHLGVSKRTVNKWRRRIALGKLTCSHSPHCRFRKLPDKGRDISSVDKYYSPDEDHSSADS